MKTGQISVHVSVSRLPEKMVKYVCTLVYLCSHFSLKVKSLPFPPYFFFLPCFFLALPWEGCRWECWWSECSLQRPPPPPPPVLGPELDWYSVFKKSSMSGSLEEKQGKIINLSTRGCSRSHIKYGRRIISYTGTSSKIIIICTLEVY